MPHMIELTVSCIHSRIYGTYGTLLYGSMFGIDDDNDDDDDDSFMLTESPTV
jgi:hypothetical protein